MVTLSTWFLAIAVLFKGSWVTLDQKSSRIDVVICC